MDATTSRPVTCEILVSLINRENILNVNSLIFCSSSIFSKSHTYRQRVLLVLSICFCISNPLGSYFIYTGSCHSIMNSNIDPKVL